MSQQQAVAWHRASLALPSLISGKLLFPWRQARPGIKMSFYSLEYNVFYFSQFKLSGTLINFPSRETMCFLHYM